MSKTVSFAEPVPGSSSQNEHFVPPVDCSGENINMDQETAQRLNENGATLIILDVPPGTEIGIDMQTWRTGPEFRGIKMIPSGLHFVNWSSVSKEGSMGPKTGFFHNFGQKEVLVRKFDPKLEDVIDTLPDDEVQRYSQNLRSLDRNLGAYPYGQWKKWISLTNKISAQTILRLEPISGKIHSVTELLPTDQKSHEEEAAESARCKTAEEREQNLLPNMKVNPKGVIRYTLIPKQKYPPGASPAEITKHNMDSTHQLELFLQQFRRLYGDQVSSSMSDRNQIDEVLAELQFSFVCFLVGQHYDSFEQWKKQLCMLCTCEEALVKHPELYLSLISDMHFQIREVPNDFFVDIVSSNNFLVTILNRMFSFVRNNPGRIDSRLVTKSDKFQANLSAKFNWVFDDSEDEEDKPVIVENV